MKLFQFELKKLFFSKKFVYLMLLLVAGIALLFIRNIMSDSYVEKEESQRVAELLQAAQSNFRMHQHTLEQDPDNEEVQQLQQINSPLIDVLYDLRALVPTEEWEQQLLLENEAYHYITEYKDEGGDFPLTYQELNHMSALNEKLLEENISPEHDSYTTTLPNFMKMIVQLFIQLGAIILIILLVGDILTSEFESRSMNLLFTQPLQKTHIITSKFIVSIIAYLSSVGIVLLTAWLVGVFFGEEGTFQYPLVMEKNNVIQFLTVSEYMVQAVIVASVTVFMIVSLILFYSQFFKHTLPMLFALLSTIVAGYALSTFITWPLFAWFNPFLYVLSEEVILFQNDRAWYQGIPIVIFVTILLYIVARSKMKTSKIG